MERFPEMTSKVTTLARAAGMEDPGRVADDVTQRPDPEVPERARPADVHREVQAGGPGRLRRSTRRREGRGAAPRGPVFQPHRLPSTVKGQIFSTT